MGRRKLARSRKTDRQGGEGSRWNDVAGWGWPHEAAIFLPGSPLVGLKEGPKARAPRTWGPRARNTTDDRENSKALLPRFYTPKITLCSRHVRFRASWHKQSRFSSQHPATNVIESRVQTSLAIKINEHQWFLDLPNIGPHVGVPKIP